MTIQLLSPLGGRVIHEEPCVDGVMGPTDIILWNRDHYVRIGIADGRALYRLASMRELAAPTEPSTGRTREAT